MKFCHLAPSSDAAASMPWKILDLISLIYHEPALIYEAKSHEYAVE